MCAERVSVLEHEELEGSFVEGAQVPSFPVGSQD